ncbi:UNVERIFIED_CONTAM: putative polyol transporter 4 [Sesamum calycinum]|uniref:Polyol transporter 4 n=1 Tax=Sesamum calycinum TaxID=2727403 RepID=A0AAW2PPD1_9LAMI
MNLKSQNHDTNPVKNFKELFTQATSPRALVDVAVAYSQRGDGEGPFWRGDGRIWATVAAQRRRATSSPRHWQVTEKKLELRQDRWFDEMGVQENGNTEMGMSLGAKNKYRRMDSQVTHDDGFDDDYDASRHSHQLERRRTTRRYVFACSVFASLNNVLLGYDVGVMSGAILFIQEDLKITEVQQEILVGILSVMSLLGSLGGGRTSDAIGRKWTMGLAAIVFQAGAAVMTLAPSFEVLMIGRILAGVGIGFGVMIAPVYIAEISPTVSRGSLTSFPEIFINLGILLGYVSNYAFSGLPAHTNWRIMLAVGILPSVFIAFALCIIPESPRWLVLQNRVDEARNVLLKTNENEAEVEERLAEIELAAGIGDSGKLEESRMA